VPPAARGAANLTHSPFARPVPVCDRTRVAWFRSQQPPAKLKVAGPRTLAFTHKSTRISRTKPRPPLAQEISIDLAQHAHRGDPCRMDMPKTIFLAGAIGLSGGACAPIMEANRPHPVDLSQFHPGQQHRSDVVDVLGSPTNSVKDGLKSCDAYQLYTHGPNAVGKAGIAFVETFADVITAGASEVLFFLGEGATRNNLYTVTMCYGTDGTLLSVNEARYNEEWVNVPGYKTKKMNYCGKYYGMFQYPSETCRYTPLFVATDQVRSVYDNSQPGTIAYSLVVSREGRDPR